MAVTKLSAPASWTVRISSPSTRQLVQIIPDGLDVEVWPTSSSVTELPVDHTGIVVTGGNILQVTVETTEKLWWRLSPPRDCFSNQVSFVQDDA